jgi:hypothetical protein
MRGQPTIAGIMRHADGPTNCHAEAPSLTRNVILRRRFWAPQDLCNLPAASTPPIDP